MSGRRENWDDDANNTKLTGVIVKLEHGSNQSVEVHIPTWKKKLIIVCLQWKGMIETWSYLKLNNSNKTFILSFYVSLPSSLCFLGIKKLDKFP